MFNEEAINNLIWHLMAVQNYCKDIHYNCKGDTFYSKHLLVDRVQENISEYIDNIKEIFFLAKGLVPRQSKFYLDETIVLIPPISKEDKKSFEQLQELILDTLQRIEEVNTTTKGESSLIDSIGQDLQQSLGLINKQVY